MRLPENLYKCPDDAWTTPMGIGAFAIRFSEPRRPEITAHCYDFARELNDKHSRLRKRYEDLEEGLIFLKVCRIRFEDSDDEAMPMGPSLMVPYFQIVFFYLDPDDNTFENRKKTANMVCEDMTIHAAQSWRNHKDTEFWFPKFRFAGDVTDPDEDEYPPPATKMLDKDVMDFMDRTYYYPRDIQAKELAILFFGSREDAPALIRGWPVPID